MEPEGNKLEDLEEIRNNLRFALKAAGAGTWFLDLVNGENRWDDRALELFGTSKEEFDFTYEGWRQLVHPDDVEQASSDFMKAVNTGDIYTNTHRVIKPNNEIVYILAQGYIKQNEAGESIGVLGLVFDVTEKINKERDLQIAKEAAEAANIAKSQFLANMSHEIRTPMNAILGFAQLLHGVGLGEDDEKYVEYILSSGTALLSLINDILDLSRVESGKMDLEYTPVELDSLAESLRNVFIQKVHEKDLYFQIVIDPNIPRYLLLAEDRLKQVLINLIGNAIKFTEHGGIKLIISQEEGLLSGQTFNINFSVEDTGMGVPEEQSERIFGSFEQLSGQSVNKYGGAGLGLAISKMLSELMNGNIALKSEVGKGSSFILQLQEVYIAPESELSNNFKNQEKMYAFESARILIVDDVVINRDLLMSYLKGYDFELFYASNGEEACMQAPIIQPDLILMDYKMPGMDGLEATRRIKKEYEVPVIMISASAMKDQEEQILFECDDFLTKPLRKDDLVNTMSTHLKHKVIS